MANIKFKVVHTDDKPAEVKTRPTSELAFERRFDRSFDEGFPRREHIYFLAWHAETKGVGDFDEWMDTVTDIEVLGWDTVDPSQAAPSTT